MKITKYLKVQAQMQKALQQLERQIEREKVPAFPGSGSFKVEDHGGNSLQGSTQDLAQTIFQQIAGSVK